MRTIKAKILMVHNKEPKVTVSAYPGGSARYEVPRIDDVRKYLASLRRRREFAYITIEDGRVIGIKWKDAKENVCGARYMDGYWEVSDERE